MPKIIIHAPISTFDYEDRKKIVGELTDFDLECEDLPLSPLVRSTVWTYFNLYRPGMIFTGSEEAKLDVVSMEIFVIKGGLTDEAKDRLITGATAILNACLGSPQRPPIYIVIHEVQEVNWGIFGMKADLAALRNSSIDAAAI
jgi:phenylpyruvate tautomerase PptA (4-oxalocrotonate tautomerase family)